MYYYFIHLFIYYVENKLFIIYENNAINKYEVYGIVLMLYSFYINRK